MSFGKSNVKRKKWDLSSKSKKKGNSMEALIRNRQCKVKKSKKVSCTYLSSEIKKIKESKDRAKKCVKRDSIASTNTTFTRTPNKN